MMAVEGAGLVDLGAGGPVALEGDVGAARGLWAAHLAEAKWLLPK